MHILVSAKYVIVLVFGNTSLMENSVLIDDFIKSKTIHLWHFQRKYKMKEIFDIDIIIKQLH